MIQVPLTQGKCAVIDEKDGPRVLRYKWTLFFNPRNGKYYARRSIWGKKQGTVYLHRFILNAPKDKQVDHRNNDGLDCRRLNLRLADNSTNHQNMKRSSANTSGFKGVYYAKRRDCKYKKPFVARITLRRKCYNLGMFASAEEAGRAYDAKAKELFGEFARLNFPEEGR